jgi:hypothetical protein
MQKDAQRFSKIGHAFGSASPTYSIAFLELSRMWTLRRGFDWLAIHIY